MLERALILELRAQPKGPTGVFSVNHVLEYIKKKKIGFICRFYPVASTQ